MTRHFCLLFVSVGLLLVGDATVANAQGGVYVDSDGVLRTREVRSDIRQKARAKTGEKDELCYISLHRLFAEAKSRVSGGNELPDQMKYLDGLVKLQYVFVFPEDRDLVIAGPADAFDAKKTDQPIGASTGRPVLRLDDLIVALRTLGPGGKARAFGCTIDLPTDAAARISQATANLGPIYRGKTGGVGKPVASAIGQQDVKFFGIDADTPTAFACLEADFLLKRLALGLTKSPVKGIRSHLSMKGSNEANYNRWWFTAAYDPLLMTSDGSTFEIRGNSLKISTSNSARDNDAGSSPAARKFAEQVTEHMPELANAVPPIGRLCNIADLGLLAALIAQDQLHEKTSLDLSWVMDPNGFPVTKVKIAKHAEPLVNTKQSGTKLTVAVGGVQFDYARLLASSNRPSSAEQKPAAAPRRPETGKWSLRQSNKQ